MELLTTKMGKNAYKRFFLIISKMEERIVEVYWSIGGEYHAFLREKLLNGSINRGPGLYFLQIYDLSSLNQFSRIVDICDRSERKSRDDVKSEIEGMLES